MAVGAHGSEATILPHDVTDCDEGVGSEGELDTLHGSFYEDETK